MNKMMTMVFLVFGLLPALSLAEVKSGAFELLYTAPVETTLVLEEFRSPLQGWPELFDGAKKTIDIAQFYIAWQDGEALAPILDSLANAGKRGVKIRFLLEKKMLKQSEEGIALLKKIPNLELRVMDFGKVSDDGIIHAKYLIVDGVRAYVGSHNFDWRSLKHIQEAGVLITDSKMAGQLQGIFNADWTAQSKAEKGTKVAVLQLKRPVTPAETRSGRAYLVASPWALNPKGVGDSEAELVKLLSEAKDEALIQVMNYYPLDHRRKKFYPVIDNAIRAAAVRGVKIKLLVADWTMDKPAVFHVKSLALIPNVQIKVISIPQAAEGFIPFSRVSHAKYMVIDGKRLWIGTSNWTGGYLENSRNIELVFNDGALAGKMAEIHHKTWESPYASALDLTRDYPKIQKDFPKANAPKN